MTDEKPFDSSDMNPTKSLPESKQQRRSHIGPFRLLQQIGEGGMGSVWMADQQEPINRRVALKVIKAGMDSKQVIARFEAERQALAMMDHQNIAKVLDAGMTEDGRPYFAMELVQGIPITQYCDRNKLTPDERLELFVPVCQAIQHAHQKGIIHRDLKPSNVLVTLYDGKPVPKVIDFGLAKALQHQVHLTDKTLFTEFGQVVGTLQYMSPEQAEMNALDVDTRTDIYSLGVMLYELLTGSTPLDKQTIQDKALLKVLEVIKETEPPRPSTRLSESGDAIRGISEQRKIAPTRLQQILRHELDWIVMKSLEKDRSRRYETANDFALDVQRFLNDEPVVARPPSAAYRFKKTIRKHRVALASCAFVLALVVITIFGTMILAKRERDAVIASSLVDRLVDAEISQIENIIEDLIPYQSLAAADLVAAYKNSPDDSRQKLHTALAMLSGGDDSVLDYLGQRLLTIEPAQFATVRDIMRPHASSLLDGYWQIIGDGSAGDARPFQAACALATFDSNNEKWQDEEFATELAEHIVGVLPSHLKPWRDALRPVKANLTESLAAIYRNDDEGEQKRFSATDTLAAWLGDDADGLFGLLADANKKQFAPIFDKLADYQERSIELGHAEIAKSPVDDASEDNKETLAIRQANAAVMLMRMNAPDQAWRLLRHSPDPRVRSYIINWLGPLGGDPNTIMARYEQETDVTIKRALLLCLGEFSESQLPESERKPLIDMLLTVYRSDPDSGLHGAAEWLLREWGQFEKIAAMDKVLQRTAEQLLAGKENERRWYVNGQGQTFTILDAGEFQMGSPESEVGYTSFESIHHRKIDRRFAISTKEVTKAQWRKFSESAEVWAANQKQVEAYIRTDDSPMVGMTWFEAAQYCNWLSEQQGIPNDQWCYQPNDEGKFGPGMRAKENFLALTGYRLPTEAEWEFSCRAGARTSRYYGQSELLLLKYVRHAENSDNQTWPVAGLKPNDFGLFDMLGNTYEWCYDAIRNYPPDSKDAASDAPGTEAVLETSRRILRGGSFSGRPLSFRSAFRGFDVPHDRDTNGGFRPARTYPLFP